MDFLKLATTLKILRLFAIFLHKLVYIRFIVEEKLALFKTCIFANINAQDYAEYNDDYKTAYFDTMVHLRKEKTHQISL